MSKNTTIAIVVICVLVLTTLMLCYTFGVFGEHNIGSNTPEGIANTFIKAVTSENATLLVQCYPSCFYSEKAEEVAYMAEEFEKYDYDDLEIVLGEISELPDMIKDAIEYDYGSYHFQSEEVEDISDYKMVELKIGNKGDDPETYVSYTMILVKYNREWKVCTPNLLWQFEVFYELLQ